LTFFWEGLERNRQGPGGGAGDRAEDRVRAGQHAGSERETPARWPGLDRVFTDKASGRDTVGPQLAELLRFARGCDTVIVHSMDRLARDLDDLSALVQGLTSKGVRAKFVKRAWSSPARTPPSQLHALRSWWPSPSSNATSSENAKGRHRSSQTAAPTKDEKRPSHRNEPLSWSSAPATVTRKPPKP
jgi:Resolvase, N terminal domain